MVDCLKSKLLYFFTAILLTLSIMPVISFADSTDNPTTGFEDSNSTIWTTLEEEYDFVKGIEKASERVRVSQVGESVEGRPINLIRVGYPEAPSDDEIADGRNIFIMGTPHGNEPAGREMVLKVLRDLAFTEDQDKIDMMENSTVLLLTTPNPDGRKANRRTNNWGIDNNRDNLNLVTPENQALAEILNTFKPDITVDAHERPSGNNPDIEFLWPRNLNVDRGVYELNVNLVEDYLLPDLEEAGFSTGLYGSPTGAGREDERILRNLGGLRHGLTLLTETAGSQTPERRVDMQTETIYSVFNFYQENFDAIAQAVDAAPTNKQNDGKNKADFYLAGADDTPDKEEIIEPAVCGYLLHTDQAKKIKRHIELFSLETEQVREDSVFITMDQPMMTVIPFLLDDRANYNEVIGKPLENCDNLHEIDPPEPIKQSDPETYETYFDNDEIGKVPEGWSAFWRDSNWEVKDNPLRLEHYVDNDGKRRALTWDTVDEVYGDVEISGLVRANNLGDTMFQIGFHISGEAGKENYYYLDMRSPSASSRANQIRIGKYDNGSYTLLGGSGTLPFTVGEDMWYQVVLQREGNVMKAKAWPYGENEPSSFQVMGIDSNFNKGKIGVGNFTKGTTNDWAFIGVGTGGEQAPRAKEGIKGIVSTGELSNLVESIETENLNEDDYTNDSWNRLNNALVSAKFLLENTTDATQQDINEALHDLGNARDELRRSDAVQYETNFSEYEVGQSPSDWSQIWQDSNWIVNDNPSRLTHTVGENGKRQGLVWDKVGEVEGDVEVSGVIRADNTGDTLFQMGIYMSGEEGNENAYYLDLRKPDANGSANRFRINRYSNGKYKLLKSVANNSFTVTQNEWYEVVFKREGNTMKAKVWPYGEEEPDFELEFTDDTLSKGMVGLAATSPGTINDWAYVGIGTGGKSAPRAPEDLLDTKVEKSELQKLIEEIEAEELEKADYTEGSWSAYEEAIEAANTVLSNEDATQEEVDAALEALTTAYEGLEKADKTSKDALQEKVEEIKAEELDASHYTDESWKAFQTALRISEELLKFDKIGDSIINKALNNLELAYEELTEK